MNPAASSAPRLNEGLASLSADKDLVLCDVWGVIHNGVRYFEPAVDALCRFRARGGTVVLITNAPVPETQVCDRLDRLRVPPSAYDAVVTAGDVTVDLIVEAGGGPIFTIGPAEDVAIFQEAVRRGTRARQVADVDEASLAVCIGLDQTGDRPADYDDILLRMLGCDLKLICANPDIVVEVGHDLVYCAGAIAERYASRGGSVIHTGKPYPAIYERAIAIARTIRGDTVRARMLAVGDGLATDIAGAASQDIASVFVTTGIHRVQLHGPAGDPTLDPSVLARFLEGSAATPQAASPYLFW